ncbi:SRPBCC domain-containing protein [Motiliproteus sp. MSK22-1]|uniref:SRPBCC family protein n=1 Tax=Motiliproteus sp. MSK22-1 TaxID=1897630 RepID=UPI0009769938|nr:SRPBCC domain-containing protein [Motiliproteus sp. MSK22-1]OMH38016.1 hypothetical protein BGP75_06950 [Motiliproteus sp. MSK22-1]
MFQLTINRKFDAPVNKLFDAWCKPEVIRQWFAPGNMSVPEAEADVQVGGKYRIVMQDPDDNSQHIVGGEYQEVENNQKLAFTWQWEGSPNITHITLTFSPIDENSSELRLCHSEFADQQTCEKHEMGWNGCLAKLINLQLP